MWCDQYSQMCYQYCQLCTPYGWLPNILPVANSKLLVDQPYCVQWLSLAIVHFHIFFQYVNCSCHEGDWYPIWELSEHWLYCQTYTVWHCNDTVFTFLININQIGLIKSKIFMFLAWSLDRKPTKCTKKHYIWKVNIKVRDIWYDLSQTE